MHLAIPFTLLMGSYVAAARSIQHAQVSVEVTNMDAYDQVEAFHSSEEPVMNNGGRGLKTLPFNFTLTGRHANGLGSLVFGIEHLNAADGFARGELGFRTEFAFRNGKLINGNRALGYHAARIFPPWTALSSLKGGVNAFPELIAVPQHAGGRPNYFIEFERPDLIFGALRITRGEPIFVGPPREFHRSRLLLAVEHIRKSSDDAEDAEDAEDADDESAEDLL